MAEVTPLRSPAETGLSKLFEASPGGTRIVALPIPRSARLAIRRSA